MIFSTKTKEIYYLLSNKFNLYEKDILKKIMKYKREEEDKDTIQWYEKRGIIKKRIYKINNNKRIVRLHDLYKDYSISRMYYLKILLESYKYDGFILNEGLNNKYVLPNLKEKVTTLNHIKEYQGITDIHEKLFHFTTDNLTDMVGNKCVRSIIRIKKDDEYIYNYKTIAINKENEYIEPIERLNTLIN